MSQAFVREQDGQWLHEIAPTLQALINYLSKENNGIKVYEKNHIMNAETGKYVYEMSNGLNYSVDADGKWTIVD